MEKIQNRMIWVLGVMLTVGGICYAEGEYTPDRYTVILDRSPFGSDSLTGDVTTPIENKQAQATAAAMEKSCRLSFLFKSNTGERRAGFQNLKPKKGDPLSNIIRVGESFMGMKLKSVDIENSEATLEHNGQPLTFHLAKQKEQATKITQAPPAQKFGAAMPPVREKPVASQLPDLTPAEQQERREEIRKSLQDYQMEVIRKGMPPLPIPLTPEMDNQLVAEGVLPPTQ